MTIEQIDQMLAWLDEGIKGPYRADADHYDDFWVHGIAGAEWIATIGQTDSPADANARNIAALLNGIRPALEAAKVRWKLRHNAAVLEAIEYIIEPLWQAFKEARDA